MSKLFSTIIFSFLLLFQTLSIADDNATSEEILAEEAALEQNEVSEEAQAQEETIVEDDPQVEAQAEPIEKEVPDASKEVISDAQKEALAAEAAELRELGIEEEPLPE